MNNQKLDKVEIDVRDNKIKQGSLLKQSRHLKQWKERWIVLTKTYIYSFTNKGHYKNPTEVISLKDVQTIKSYYKDQYKKPFTFRVQSQDVNLHMSVKSSDQKLAWITAIQKMIERVIHPETTTDTYNLIRETIKMSTAVRQTLQKKQQKQRKQSTDFTDRLLSKLRLTTNSQIIQFNHYPQTIIKKNITGNNQLQILSNQQKKTLEKSKKQQTSINQLKSKNIIKMVQKIAKVPEISQIIIQKIVYKQTPKDGNSTLIQVLKQLVLVPNQNPRVLVNFVVYLLTSTFQHYQSQILQFCLDSQARRFFAQVFLLMMNQQIDEQILNSYLKFLLVIYQNCNQYFYSSDLKALIGILIRQIQLNRSEFNQYLVMSLLKQMAEKDWWSGLNYRRSQIKAFVKQLGAISGPENQFLSQQLLSKL